MCLIVLAWRPGHALPLLVAANRDEFYARPTAALAEWPETPGLIAGRDLQAGGTWLGIGPGGRFAALTNIRDPRAVQGSRSRGELPLRFLQGYLGPEAFLDKLRSEADDYSGFNLLVGDRQQLWHFNSQNRRAKALPSGIHGISNADLDTPWPKLQRAKAALVDALETLDEEALFALLANTAKPEDAALPDTGVGLDTERLLASVFIASANYGTRASTLLFSHADGARQLIERSFGAEGVAIGEVRFETGNQWVG
ncbi:NRDE family protein [Pseudomonas sp. MM211]|uniref:NRDE family protein n=1 Tax=Pseudomonas sp. MM211 TaxID=2866808 RepID=UPI001CED9A05|nr:NRDE family protein [Pseudomonas sp. MM211]UCJ17860.1 NRDE family protein [Pseudomonas sp. MM211]